MAHLLCIGITVLLLLIAAFLSGSETAVTGASKAYLYHLAKKGDKNAKKVIQLKENMSLSIETILVMNQLILFIIPILSAWYSFNFLTSTQGTIYTSAIGLLIIIYAEICPKIVAIRFIIPFALFAAPIIAPAVKILKHVVLILEACAKISLRLVGIKMEEQKNDDQSMEELRGAIEMHTTEEPEEEQKKSMLKSILDLEEVSVNQAMVHRKHLRTLNGSLSIEELAKEIIDCPFSRIPIWKESPENIIGILKVKTFFKVLQFNNGDISKIQLSSLMSAPWYIPETTSLLDQLENFRKKREHFALVVDEYGDLLGCITLEDILEEIVGDIIDEYDNKDIGDDVKVQADGSIIVNGATPIRDLNRQFDWDIPEKTATTIAGYIMYQIRKIPDISQVYVLSGFRFEILRKQRNQIVLIKITPQISQPNTSEDEDLNSDSI